MLLKQKKIQLLFFVVVLSLCTIMLNVLTVHAALTNQSNKDKRVTDKKIEKEYQEVESSEGEISCSLQEHFKQYEEQRKNFQFHCDTCGKLFSRKKQLNAHEAIIHNRLDGYDLFKCKYPDCKEVYAAKCNLDRHMRLHHLPCKEQVKNDEALKIHQESCTICQETISSKKTLMSKIALTRVDKKTAKNDDPDKICATMPQQECNSNNQNMNNLIVDERISKLIHSHLEIIYNIKNNLLIVNQLINNNQYSDTTDIFSHIKTRITQLRESTILLLYTDLTITKYKHVNRIKMILDILNYIEMISSSNTLNKAHLIICVWKKTDEFSNFVHEIFKDWLLVLPKTEALKICQTALQYAMIENDFLALKYNEFSKLPEDVCEVAWSEDSLLALNCEAFGLSVGENIYLLNTDSDFTPEACFENPF